MQTDLDFYTACMIDAKQAARRASSREAQLHFERLARTFTMQVQKVQNTPTLITPEPLRLRPLQLAA